MNSPIQKRSQRDESRRLPAVALFEAGLSNAEIARRLHLSRQSVSGWNQRWKQPWQRRSQSASAGVAFASAGVAFASE